MTEKELGSIISSSAPRVDKSKLREIKKGLGDFLNKFSTSKYFALMGMPSLEGNSTRYVTIFNINKNNAVIDINNNIYNFILDNETYLGELKGYLKQENYIEFWFGSEVYLFFPYDTGVIEIGY